MTERYEPLTGDQFDALFNTVAVSAFRYEGLPVYGVDEEDDDLAAWRDGRAMAERSVRTDPWLARIARHTVVDDIAWCRVRHVTDPPSWYLAFEAPGYVESQAVGERILLTTERVWGGPDFWLLDRNTRRARAVIQFYDADGNHVRNELAPPGHRIIPELERATAALIAVGEPLNGWLVRHRAELDALAGVRG
ncbi:MAG: hypothetical protein L0I24_06860 [Pseudonocardia sp.]|nr:hypothetical protein [Pseudonocardia sp.]